MLKLSDTIGYVFNFALRLSDFGSSRVSCLGGGVHVEGKGMYRPYDGWVFGQHVPLPL